VVRLTLATRAQRSAKPSADEDAAVRAPSNESDAARLASTVGNRALGGLLQDVGHDAEQRADGVRRVLATPGKPLEPRLERELGARFGTHFRGARIHADAAAAEAARNVEATAFTVGQHVVFGAGRYAPETGEGRALLAHELAHTVQQRGATASAGAVPRDSPLEATATGAAQSVAAGSAAPSALGSSPIAVAREVPGVHDDRNDEQVMLELALVAQTLQRFAARGRAYSDSATVLRQQRDEPTFWEDYDRVATRFAVLRATLERRRAVAEATEVGLRKEESEPPEAPLVVPMALEGDDGTPAPEPRPAPKPPRAPDLPARFLPGGFTNREIDKLTAEGDERTAPPTDKRPFMQRWYAARRDTPSGDDGSPGKVWRTGLGEGLFAEYEEDAFDQVWEDKIGGPARDEAHRNAAREKQQLAMAQQAEFDNLQSQLNLMPIQAVLMGEVGVFGRAAQVGYEGYTYVDIARQTHHAAVSGKPEDAVSVLLPLVAGKVAHLPGLGDEPLDPATPTEATVTEHVGAPPESAPPPTPDPISPGTAGGEAQRLDPLTPDDMVTYILNQRGFTANRPGTLNQPGAGVGTGYSTNSMVQVIGADGTQLATEVSRYGGSRDLHAEQQALGALGDRLGDAELQGGTVRVAVDQNTCAECTNAIRQFAVDHKLARIEVYGPSRSSLAGPPRAVSPKTAARTHFGGTAPPAQATLLWAENLEHAR
jgi:hypothetical protein